MRQSHGWCLPLAHAPRANKLCQHQTILARVSTERVKLTRKGTNKLVARSTTQTSWLMLSNHIHDVNQTKVIRARELPWFRKAHECERYHGSATRIALCSYLCMQVRHARPSISYESTFIHGRYNFLHSYYPLQPTKLAACVSTNHDFTWWETHSRTLTSGKNDFMEGLRGWREDTTKHYNYHHDKGRNGDVLPNNKGHA
jgi:hypothetical protein